MRKGGIINGQLAGALARLGHTDRLVVYDAGFPIPDGPELVGLAFRFGVPSFEIVLSGFLDELVVEDAIAAEEVREQNQAAYETLGLRLEGLDLIPHEQLKRAASTARLFVRTGEATPFSNVILCCEVPF